MNWYLYNIKHFNSWIQNSLLFRSLFSLNNVLCFSRWWVLDFFWDLSPGFWCFCCYCKWYIFKILSSVCCWCGKIQFDFCFLALYPETMLKSLMNLNILSVALLRYTYAGCLWVRTDLLLLFQLLFILLIFLCLIVLYTLV